MTKGNILIVDDTPSLLRFLSARLTERGYKVRGVVSGQMALTVARAARPDVVVLDIKMPEMDGFEVCQRLKADPQTREIPVIFLTILDESTSKVKAFSEGGVDYITKPFQVDELIARIENQLTIRRLQRQLQEQTQQLQEQNELLQQEIQNRDRALAQLREAETALRISQEAIRQQVERERLLSEVTQRIRQSLDLNAVLNTAVAEVRQLLQTDRVVIYRFDPDWSGIVIVESVGSGWTAMGERRLYDPCLAIDECVIAYTRGKISSIEDIYTAGLADCYVDLLAQFEVRANLVIPILQGEILWGLLAAQHCAAPRQWQPAEIDFLTQLSNQVSIALQQAELYQQVQHLNQTLEQQVQERTVQLNTLMTEMGNGE